MYSLSDISVVVDFLLALHKIFNIYNFNVHETSFLLTLEKKVNPL